MASLLPEVNQYRYPWLQYCFRQIDEDNASCAALLIGQVSPNTGAQGLAAVDQVTRINSTREAIDLFGEDAIISKMVEQHFCQGAGKTGRAPTVFVGAVANGTTQAEYTYTITGTSTEYSPFYLELPKGARITATASVNRMNANEVYSFSAAPGTTDAEIVAGLAAAINADTGALFVAVAAANVLTLTAKTGGTAMNGIGLEVEPTPLYSHPNGISAAWAQTVVGAGDPDITTLMGNLGNCCYVSWALGFDDGLARQLIIEELRDNRWDCNGDNCFGHLFAPVRDTFTNLYTAHEATNNAEVTYVGLPPMEKYPSFVHAAAWAGLQTHHFCTAADPSIPVVRELGKLECMVASQVCGASPFTRSETNFLAAAGVGTWSVGVDGRYRIQNNITNYKRDSVGQADGRWSETSTRYVVPAIRDIISDFFTEWYSNSRIKRNGSVLNPGSNQASPLSIKSHLLGWLREDSRPIANSISEEILNGDATGDGLVVTLDPVDCNRVNVGIKYSLIQPLMRVATTVDIKPCVAA